MSKYLEPQPEGMYPLDCDYEPNLFDSFDELRTSAEAISDCLNLPLSWHMHDEYDADWGKYLDAVEQDSPMLELVFLMPRKGQTFGMQTRNFDRYEVQEWLDTWLRGEINTWFGWDL